MSGYADSVAKNHEDVETTESALTAAHAKLCFT